MRVLLTVASLGSSYGGPAYSVSRLASALCSAGLDVHVWTPDGSATHDQTGPFGPKFILVTGRRPSAVKALGHLDIIHDNGIWLYHNYYLAKLAAHRSIPRIVSTRGMLEPWAMRHKRLKKRLAWVLYQRRDLHQAAAIHTTADAEAVNVGLLDLKVPVCVIPNGVDVPAQPGTRVLSNTPRTKKALFVGRIYPIKGLPMLVEAWAAVRPRDWILRIAGPDEAGHLADVKRAVRANRLETVVHFLGPLAGEKKSAAYHESDLFVLPSHSESFGIAVAEALAHGVPVLTTKGAPWRVVQDRGFGWWVDASTEGLIEGLRSAVSQDAATLCEMGAKGRDFVSSELNWNHIARAFIAKYDEVLSSRGMRGRSAA